MEEGRLELGPEAGGGDGEEQRALVTFEGAQVAELIVRRDRGSRRSAAFLERVADPRLAVLPRGLGHPGRSLVRRQLRTNPSNEGSSLERGGTPSRDKRRQGARRAAFQASIHRASGTGLTVAGRSPVWVLSAELTGSHTSPDSLGFIPRTRELCEIRAVCGPSSRPEGWTERAPTPTTNVGGGDSKAAAPTRNEDLGGTPRLRVERGAGPATRGSRGTSRRPPRRCAGSSGARAST